MFSYVSAEVLVPQAHPLRVIRPLVNAALDRRSARFERMYAASGGNETHASTTDPDARLYKK